MCKQKIKTNQFVNFQAMKSINIYIDDDFLLVY